MFRFLTCTILILFAMQTQATKKRLLIDLSRSKAGVEFLAIGRPSFIKIRGKSDKLGGRLLISQKSLSGTVSIPLASLDTGMGLRNRHMTENYLHVDRFPKALLKFRSVSLPENFLKAKKVSAKSIPFKGTLKLHGIKKSVRGVASLERNGNRISGQAKFKINITDFEIKVPSFKGITVAKEVTISVNINSKIRMVKMK